MANYSNVGVEFNIDVTDAKKVIRVDSKYGDHEQVIVVVGPTGHGKSRLINFLCKKDLFVSKFNIDSISKGIEVAEVKINSPEHNINDEKYIFVDTQGLCDTRLSDPEVIKIIKESVEKNIKYVTRFVIVLRADRFTKEQREAIEFLIEAFDLSNKDRVDHVLICITKCDGLKKEKLEDLKKQYMSDPTISKLVNKFYITLNKTNEQMLIDNMMFIGIPELDDLDEEVQELYSKRMHSIHQTVWSSFQTEYDPIKPVKKWYNFCNIL